MFPFVTHQGSGKDVSFLGCAIQSTCRKSQLQIPCHILSPLHTLYRSVFSLSVVSTSGYICSLVSLVSGSLALLWLWCQEEESLPWHYC